MIEAFVNGMLLAMVAVSIATAIAMTIIGLITLIETIWRKQ